MRTNWLLLIAAMAMAVPAHAQPADLPIPAATTDQYPPGVTVRRTAAGPVYVDAKGRTLYGMDMRTVLRWSPDPAQHCTGDCAKDWEPLLAPVDSTINIAFPRGPGERGPGQPLRPLPLPPGFVSPQAAPDWTMIAGPTGPQWVYKGWHLVFTRKGERPGAAKFDGAEANTWNSLKFVPPVPKIQAPASVAATFADGAYALTDKNGHALFTGTCTAPCAWQPLTAPMAGRGIGDWAVSTAGDSPQWLLRGKPVYVSQEDNPLSVPPAGEVLRP